MLFSKIKLDIYDSQKIRAKIKFIDIIYFSSLHKGQ